MSEEKFVDFSKDEIDKLIDEYSNIAETTLKIPFNQKKRASIKNDVIEQQENGWEIEPDFYIRGKVIREYGKTERGFFHWNVYKDLYPKFNFNTDKYLEFLMFDINIDTDELKKSELMLGPGALKAEHPQKYLGKDAPHNFTFAVIKAIKEGFNTDEKLLLHFKFFFGPDYHLSSSTIRQRNISHSIEILESKKLISKENGAYIITDLGKKVDFEATFRLKHELYWTKRFLTEKMVIYSSLFCLILLAILKITFGWLIPSDGLFNDGIENLTDIIKIIIITLSIKYNKDRPGSIGIMLMMIYTGIFLGYSAIMDLIQPQSYENIFEWLSIQFKLEKKFNPIGFIIAGLSLLINLALWNLKFMVGKRSGNLSILSDAKDSVNNSYIAIGVLIGLTFEIFGISLIDILVGFGIAIIILYDGIDTLSELISKGENIDIDAIRVAGDHRYLDRISHWIILHVEREKLSRNELNSLFLEGLKIGYRYYGEFAAIGFHNLSKKGLFKNLKYLINDDIIREENNKLFLTEKGINRFNQIMKKEDKKLLKD
ncbi:MAG: cation diffusion facilitator family transporter, partial [Promethearchaeota archaeon]